MMMLDVISRWKQLRETMPALELYVLVDGLQYEMHLHERLQSSNGRLPLFAGTRDATLAHAGPWLMDMTQVNEAMTAKLVKLECDAPSLIWLITQQDLTSLGQRLQSQLDVQLPDGSSALLRFWDPRVLVSLARSLDGVQREAFFGHIQEWHLLNAGQRMVIGGAHAHAL